MHTLPVISVMNCFCLSDGQSKDKRYYGANACEISLYAYTMQQRLVFGAFPSAFCYRIDTGKPWPRTLGRRT